MDEKILHKLRCPKCNIINCLEWYNKENIYQCNKCFTLFTINDIEVNYVDCYDYDFYYEQLI